MGCAVNSCARVRFADRRDTVSDLAHSSTPKGTVRAEHAPSTRLFSKFIDVMHRQVCSHDSHILTEVHGLASNQGSGNAPSSKYSYARQISGPKLRGSSGWGAATNGNNSADMIPREECDGLRPTYKERYEII